jgi:hypothetical protein
LVELLSQRQLRVQLRPLALRAVGSIGLDPGALGLDLFDRRLLLDLLVSPLRFDPLRASVFDPLLLLELCVSALRLDSLRPRLLGPLLLVGPCLLALGVGAGLLTLGLDLFVLPLAIGPLLLPRRRQPLVQAICLDPRILHPLRALLGQDPLAVLRLEVPLTLRLQSLRLSELGARRLILLDLRTLNTLAQQLPKVAHTLNGIGPRDRLDRHNLTSTRT